MPFRSQQFAEHCVFCETRAGGVCPQCRAPVCGSHSCDPYGCCEPCATEMYFAVSRAGKRHILSGSAVAFVSWIALYMMYGLRLLPPVALMVLIAGVAGGFGAVLWGGSVSPRLVERSLLRRRLRGVKHLRQLRRPREQRLLAAPGELPPLG